MSAVLPLEAPAAAPELASDALEREIDLACVRTLFRQIPNSFVAAMVVTVYMGATLHGKVPAAWLAGWLGLQALAQLHRGWVFFSYRNAVVDVDNAGRWARRYATYMAFAGGVWAVAAALFLDDRQPLAIAFTLCGLYGIAGGSVSGNAYYRPAVLWFIWPIFITVLVRLAALGRGDFLALGLASAAFAGILTLFCRVQSASIRDSLRVRFENRELLVKLAAQTTEAESARAQAEQANLAKSQFLAAASHDLRQPLHALGLFSASLHGLVLDERAQQAVASIQTNIDALEDMFNVILDVSKLDAGVVEAHLSAQPLQPLLDKVVRQLQPLAQAKGLTLGAVPTEAWALTDLTLLQRVLGNLVSNALRYTARGGVLVAVRRDRNEAGEPGWRIECRDSGVGIAAADHARVFDEFVQLHNPQRDRRQGLGLGLAIARRIGRLIGGELGLRSRVGRGSVFHLRLPAAQACASEPAPVLAPVAHGGDLLQGRVVMVIDDEASIRDGVCMLLEQWGCVVHAAADADEALALSQRLATLDLVLADLRLPGVHDGIGAVAALRATRSAPLLACLVTGESHAASLQAARDSGLTLLHKPVRAAQLRAAFNHLVAQSLAPA
jgi:signal transduction histidine kinase/CheY-like chemotaxis protein